MDSTTQNFLLIAVLILFTALFVSTEFAIVKVRTSRIDQLVQEGNRRAIYAKKVISDLDGYLSACQLGITITALGLGWLGEPTVEKVLHPLFESLGMPVQINNFISFIIAFVSVTYIHVVLGELAPKTLAIQKAETITLLFAQPIIWFHTVMYPFIWMLNGSANGIIRLFGMKPVSEYEEAHSEEELQLIINESYESGMINNTEYGYVSRIFVFDDLLAKEIMVPRTDMICLDGERTIDENMSIMKSERYTRYPVIKDDKDFVIGIVNTKQLFLEDGNVGDKLAKELAQPVMTVSEAMPVKQLLHFMQQERSQLAILADEYGGTSGMITIEDILEEIVGEIRDEFDADERARIEIVSEDHVRVDGKVLLDELNELLHIHLVSEDFDTIGGWLYTQFPDAQKGSTMTVEGIEFTILEKERHRIKKVEVMTKNTVVEDMK
ncbi:hemolysin family protein [Paenibacillus marinisediminis]